MVTAANGVLSPNSFTFPDNKEEDYNNNDHRVVSLNQLEYDGDDEEEGNNFDTLMFIKVLYWKMATPNENKNSYYTIKGNKQGGSLNYQRMMVGMDLFAKPGKNVVTFLLGNHDNQAFFSDAMSCRDNGMLCE